MNTYVALGIALIVLARLALQLTDHFVLQDRSVGHWLGRAVRVIKTHCQKGHK